MTHDEEAYTGSYTEHRTQTHYKLDGHTNYGTHHLLHATLRVGTDLPQLSDMLRTRSADLF